MGKITNTAFEELAVATFEPMCGWTFAYNINPGLIISTVLNDGTVTHDDNQAVLQTGVEPDGYAEIRTVKQTRYIPGVGGKVLFTATFDTPREDLEQVVGLIDEEDGWAFGYNGLDFGILRRRGGEDNWIKKEDWNKDKKLNLKPAKGNVFQIRYQWLGYGAQTFYIENTEGELVPVHVIKFANTSAITSVVNPNLPMCAYVKNTGNIVNATLKTPSAISGLEGHAFNEAISLILADDVERTISGVNKPVISFFNPLTFKTKSNALFTQALFLSLSADGNKNVLFRVFANAAPTDGTFAPIEADLSPIEVNKNFTTYAAGGILIGSFPLGKIESKAIPLSDVMFRGFPGQYITIVASSAGSNDVSAAVTFRQFL